MIEDIDAEKLSMWIEKKKQIVLLDVREDYEFEQVHIEGSLNFPLSKWQCAEDIYESLPKEKVVVIVCKVGGRSFQAAHRLSTCTSEKVYNLKGGLIAWFEHNNNHLIKREG